MASIRVPSTHFGRSQNAPRLDINESTTKLFTLETNNELPSPDISKAAPPRHHVTTLLPQIHVTSVPTLIPPLFETKFQSHIPSGYHHQISPSTVVHQRVTLLPWHWSPWPDQTNSVSQASPNATKIEKSRQANASKIGFMSLFATNSMILLLLVKGGLGIDYIYLLYEWCIVPPKNSLDSFS